MKIFLEGRKSAEGQDKSQNRHFSPYRLPSENNSCELKLCQNASEGMKMVLSLGISLILSHALQFKVRADKVTKCRCYTSLVRLMFQVICEVKCNRGIIFFR